MNFKINLILPMASQGRLLTCRFPASLSQLSRYDWCWGKVPRHSLIGIFKNKIEILNYGSVLDNNE